MECFRRVVTCYIYVQLDFNGMRFTPSPTPTYPFCPEANETGHHFLQCKSNPEAWGSLVEYLTVLYNKYAIDPILRILINAAMPDKTLVQMMAQCTDLNWKS
eukprot:14178047-Ditylum_brightwellii.AAC.1